MNEYPISQERATMVRQLLDAQYYEDTAAIAQLRADLQALHVALGHRQTGTRAEQNAYLMARSTHTPFPELVPVGIDSNDWPPPPLPEAAPAGDPEPETTSADTERRITRLFNAMGPLADRLRPPARYSAVFRPEDDQRYQGTALPWAICDNETGLPVAYHPEKDIAEYQADQASELLTKRRGRGR